MANNRRTCSSLAGVDWTLNMQTDADNTVSISTDHIQTVLLWEVLQELKRLNSLLNCTNFLSIPKSLRAINRKTVEPAKKTRKAPK